MVAWKAQEAEALAAMSWTAVPPIREGNVGRFVAAYRHYCWPVDSLTDLKLAPFHLLATEGRVHADKDHAWHMETLAGGLPGRPGTAAGDRLHGRGRDRPGEPGGEGAEWWTELTGRGGEGMVVKPSDFHSPRAVGASPSPP